MNRKKKKMTEPVSNTDELEPQGEAVTDIGDEAEGAPEAAAAVGDDTGNAGAGAGVEAAEAGGEEADDTGDGTSLDAELLALREEFEALNDRHLRLAAEFNNYRRRVEQERLDLWARAQADLLAKLLDVLDDLQRVAELDLESATVEGIMEGIDLVERKFQRVLGDAGVEVLDPVGEAFDPEVMEAMMREPADSEEDDDTVARVLQKGYRLKGQLVRPARVSVHKHG